MKLFVWIILSFLSFLFLSCASTPIERCSLVAPHPLLQKENGVLIIVDACVNYDELGEEGDCCVINASKKCTYNINEITQKIFTENEIKINQVISPCICSTINSKDEALINFAEDIGSPIQKYAQPFSIDESTKMDEDYINAISNISTYIFHKTINPDKNESKKDAIISDDEFAKSISIISSKTNPSSILVINVFGQKISSGKKTAGSIGSFLVGMTTAIATAGLGAGVWVGIFPESSKDGRLILAALIDIDNDSIAWKNYVRGTGDPVKTIDLHGENDLKLLLRNVIYSSIQDIRNTAVK